MVVSRVSQREAYTTSGLKERQLELENRHKQVLRTAELHSMRSEWPYSIHGCTWLSLCVSHFVLRPIENSETASFQEPEGRTEDGDSRGNVRIRGTLGREGCDRRDGSSSEGHGTLLNG